MKPTNYHLFDFLDIDTELSRNESLWKAYKPTAVYEKEGDIYVTVPFQKQKLANDMMADTDVPQEEYTLIIRQYNIGITRLHISQCRVIRIRKSRKAKVSGSGNLINQSARNHRMIIIHDIQRNIPHFKIHCPRHKNHDHARKEQDKTRKKRITHQLLKFFFNKKLDHSK